MASMMKRGLSLLLAGGVIFCLCACGGPMVTPAPTPAATPEATPVPTPTPVPTDWLGLAREGKIGWALRYLMEENGQGAGHLYNIIAFRASDGYLPGVKRSNAVVDLEQRWKYDKALEPYLGPEMMPPAFREKWCSLVGEYWDASWLKQEQAMQQAAQVLQSYLANSQQAYQTALLENGLADDPLRVAHGMDMAIYPSFAWGQVTQAQINTLVDSGLICYAVGRRELPQRPQGYPEGIDDRLAIHYEAIPAEDKASVDIILLAPYGEGDHEYWMQQLSQWLKQNTDLEEERCRVAYGRFKSKSGIGTPSDNETPPKLTRAQALALMQAFPNAYITMAYNVQDNVREVMAYNAAFYGDGVYVEPGSNTLWRDYDDETTLDNEMWTVGDFDLHLYKRRTWTTEPGVIICEPGQTPPLPYLDPRYYAPADRTY
nr:hypothetical protein [bacterium]